MSSIFVRILLTKIAKYIYGGFVRENEVYKVLKYLVSTILLILTAGTVAAGNQYLFLSSAVSYTAADRCFY